ncbi:uncharacterized protein LOC118644550 isoform X2 [Monomorium pharaonis]|uniref:uncharacterized protein LOC118644550 isoform X2 n=1 Tax=Monomorium pharaonis TaxID=307658 RepID=UPI0017479303|nr:uncharacterized protein LOC118644550 isoform X2 [Monomorium pharaonis]
MLKSKCSNHPVSRVSRCSSETESRALIIGMYISHRYPSQMHDRDFDLVARFNQSMSSATLFHERERNRCTIIVSSLESASAVSWRIHRSFGFNSFARRGCSCSDEGATAV